jgi:hypothetical protein
MLSLQVVVNIGGRDALPSRLSSTLQQISVAITNRGNRMVYHDLEEQIMVSYSATAFPEDARSHFSDVVIDRGTSIIHSTPERS